MKPKNLLFALPLAAFSLGGLLLTGCAVAGQPMAKGGGWGASVSAAPEQADAAVTTSVFAAKKVRAKPAPEPQPLVAAEPLPEPKAAAEPASAVQAPAAAEPAAEPAPESEPAIAAEPAPKKRGPLTRTEEKEIDNQVMP